MVDLHILDILTLPLHTLEDKRVPELSLISVPTNDLQDLCVLRHLEVMYMSQNPKHQLGMKMDLTFTR